MPVTSVSDLDRRAEIHDLVVHFYREIVFDDLLAPVFGEVAETDWAVHIPRLIDYWSRVLLGERGYDGFVLAAHRHVHDIEPLRIEHFDRWYSLWVESINSNWAGPRAEQAKSHAARVAATLARRLLDTTWVAVGAREEAVAGRADDDLGGEAPCFAHLLDALDPPPPPGADPSSR